MSNARKRLTDAADALLGAAEAIVHDLSRGDMDGVGTMVMDIDRLADEVHRAFRELDARGPGGEG